jgi:hypothetical protein
MPLDGTVGRLRGAVFVAAGWLTTLRGLLAAARGGGCRARVA